MIPEVPSVFIVCNEFYAVVVAEESKTVRYSNLIVNREGIASPDEQ